MPAPPVKRSTTPLRWAVLLTLAVGLLLPGAALLAYNQQVIKESVMETLRADLRRNTQVLALSLIEPIWQVSPDLGQPMVDAQAEDERFVSILVTEIANSRPALQASPRPNADPTLALSHELPIEREGREIGRVKVTMSAAAPLKRAQNEMLLDGLRMLLMAAVSMGMILWLLRRRVLLPMEQLSRAADELGSGHLGKPLQFEGEDEIGRVGQAMERMRLALLEAFDRLRQHASTLEEQVAQRTAELTASNRELKQAMAQLKTAQTELVEAEKLASLGRLVAGVAHELNTPLGNAMTVVTALSDRWTELNDALRQGTPLRRSQLDALVTDTRRGQDILHRNVQRAAELVRDFKQVAVDQTSDARRVFDLDKVVEDVLVMVEPRFKATPFRIQTQLERGLRMDSYPGSLGQVLTNLVMNSLVHGFHEKEQGTVWISCCALYGQPGWVSLSVRDDGCGMDDAVRKRIFDPFFTTKLGRGGSGLGMHIVHTIVTQLLGGQIEVQSQPGHGAHMLLRLPLTAPERVESGED
ncbi:sensor histidine kinase [Inhella sp.]|uniref:sensor histidine kinase n=1 Tax=Inhella sp. TaxID=1921806 RepID=UPI0035B15D56